MLKISFIVFCAVKVNNGAPDNFRDRGRGLAASVAMKEEGLAFLAVTSKHAVNVPLCTAQCKGGAVFTAIGVVCQCLDNFVLFRFVH